MVLIGWGRMSHFETSVSRTVRACTLGRDQSLGTRLGDMGRHGSVTGVGDRGLALGGKRV